MYPLFGWAKLPRARARPGWKFNALFATSPCSQTDVTRRSPRRSPPTHSYLSGCHLSCATQKTLHLPLSTPMAGHETWTRSPCAALDGMSPNAHPVRRSICREGCVWTKTSQCCSPAITGQVLFSLFLRRRRKVEHVSHTRVYLSIFPARGGRTWFICICLCACSRTGLNVAPCVWVRVCRNFITTTHFSIRRI